MKLFIALFFIIVNAIAFSKEDVVLESVHHTNWGDWGQWQNCVFTGDKVIGFRLKTEAYLNGGDDTALNAVTFYCGDPRNPSRFTQNLTSTVGEFGVWGGLFQCGFGEGHMSGFQLRVESSQGIFGDDTATNNLRIMCSGHRPDQNIEGDGLDFGSWREVHYCPHNHAICGLQTQVEPNQWSGDDTAFNNIRVNCCPL